ncbi:MAG: exodeoxyribonuclease VII small subunit [Bacteroidales bacterium]|nr:exodeoxyribonuclease VII small subunit [Bacteroidales bacterium]
MAEKLTYKQALEKLEALVAVIEDPDHPLDKIQGEVEQAMRLVEYCKQCLAGTEKELMDIIDNK